MFGFLKRGTNRKSAEPLGATTPLAAEGALRRLSALRRPSAPQPALELRGQVLEALMVLEATLTAIDRIEALLTEAAEIIANARVAETSTARAQLATRYENLRQQIDTIAGAAEIRGHSLIGQTRPNLDIAVGGLGQGTITIRAVDLSGADTGLALPAPATDFEEDLDIQAAAALVSEGLVKVKRAAQVYVSDAAMLSTMFQQLNEKQASA